MLFATRNEVLIDTSITYIPAPVGQSFPAVAFDGNNYFVFWYDWRHGMQYDAYGFVHWDYYGCRVSRDGVLLDSSGVLISYAVWLAGWVPTKLAITYGDGKYLCAWSDFRGPYMLYGARVDTNGIVLDPDGFVISAFDSWKDPPAVAFDGVYFFVVWWDARNPSGIYGSRIRPDGTIIDPQGILISSPGGGAVSVTYDGNNYFVVWSSYPGGDIYGVRVDTSGVVLDSNAITICTEDEYQLYPSVTYGNGHYFAAWVDERAGSMNSDIYGARIDTAGVLVDTNSVQISALSEYEYYPSLCFDGINYLVTWSDYATTYCARVNTNGVLLDSLPIAVSQDTIYESSTPSVASDGVNSLIVRHTGWSDGDVYGSRVDTAGVILDTNGILLSIAAYPGRRSSSSYDGMNYFTVWTDYRDTAIYCIYGARIDTAGVILDPTGFSIVNGQNPSVAFDGSNYLVVCKGLKGNRVDTSGMVLDTIAVFPGGDYPSVVFDGTYYFVAWQYGHDIYGIRVDTAGLVLDTNGILISNQEYFEDYPSVALDGTNYFVVWQYGTGLIPYNIYGARVDTAGVILDTTVLAIATGAYDQEHPSLAYDGTNYFVVWQDSRNGYADIYGARVTPNGVVLDQTGIPICTAPSDQYQPRIAFDDENYCIIWEDWRNGNRTDIYGCYVSPSGIVLSEFIVADQPNLQLEPTLVKGSDKYLITYTGLVDSINSRPTNTLRIWGEFRQFTGIEDGAQTKTQVSSLSLRVYPNPIHQKCTLKYSVPTKTRVNISIYDVTGRLAREVINETKDVGIYRKMIDMTSLPQGVYFIKLYSSSQSKIKKIVFLK